MEPYVLAPEALQDLQDIWEFIALDNPEAASALQEDFFAAFEGLAAMPGKGHKREDLTDQAVRFLKSAPTWLSIVQTGRRSRSSPYCTRREIYQPCLDVEGLRRPTVVGRVG